MYTGIHIQATTYTNMIGTFMTTTWYYKPIAAVNIDINLYIGLLGKPDLTPEPYHI